MEVIADLHIHSPYSRATSRDITIKNLQKYAGIKGLNLLGTGDFTHPLWLRNLKENLKEDGSGVLKSGDGFSFILSAEVSNVYEQDGKTRKIHNVILAPDFTTADQINGFLAKHGNLSSDGRPVFYRMTCPELVENLVEISKDVVIIPSHAWTPWYGIFGSKSGFDSVEECFKDQAKHIFALETGLSSDPAMNWRLSVLDKYGLISNSDAHSFWPWRIGREANVFELEKLTYADVIGAIKERDNRKFKYTIEVDPAYGKYHFDGHRNCKVNLEPTESIKMKNHCPVCRRPLTIGVLHRVEELADRPQGYVPPGAVPFKSLIPLTEIIARVRGIEQLYSKQIWDDYNRLIKALGSEFNVLLRADCEEMKKVVHQKIGELVLLVREGNAIINPGFDGVYGSLAFDDAVKGEEVRKPNSPQSRLDQF
jgi:uncharacterized protein (TIGR00375 family)